MFNNRKAVQLSKESSEIVNVFQKTVTKLENVNAKIEEASAENLKKLVELKEEGKALASQHDSNSRIIKKIQEFLS